MTRASGASRAAVVSRVIASVLGSYAFTWGFATLGIALAVVLGMRFHDAQTFLFLLAFPMFLVCFFWAFTVRKTSRVWAVLAGAGLVMTLTGWLLARGAH